MTPALLTRLRPLGPWRFGPSTGTRDRVDLLLHSDVVYSAVTTAMAELGWADEWLGATAGAQSPEVAFTSLYPFQGRTLFAVPPKHLWPPQASTRVRWKGASFVPLSVISSLMRDQALQEDRWAVDPISSCLLSTDRSPTPPGPFRINVRSFAAVDRMTGVSTAPHTTACLEFGDGAGLWCAAVFRDNESRTRWADKIRAAFRLLADTGIGGKRSIGWGRASEPEFSDGNLNDLLFPASQKLKDMRPRSPKSTPQASVSGPTETAPFAGTPARNDQSQETSGTPEKLHAGGGTGSLDEPPEPPEPKTTIEEPDELQANLDDPPEPPEPKGAMSAGGGTGSLDDPPDPPEPKAQIQRIEEIEIVETDEEGETLIAEIIEIEGEDDEPCEPDLPKAFSLDDPPEPPEPKGTKSASAGEVTASDAEQSPDEEVKAAEPEQPAAEEQTQAAEAQTEVPSEIAWETVAEPARPEKAFWLLSVYSPGPNDSVDWTRGNYALLDRTGRTNEGDLKRMSRMLEEGSVIFANNPPAGRAHDVAPEGLSHPIYRAGFAVSVEVPWRIQA